MAYWRQRRIHPYAMRNLLEIGNERPSPGLLWSTWERLFACVTDAMIRTAPRPRPLLFEALDAAIARAWPIARYGEETIAVEMLEAAVRVLAPSLLQVEIRGPASYWLAEDGEPFGRWLSRQPPFAMLEVRARPLPDPTAVDLVVQHLAYNQPASLAAHLRHHDDARSPPTLLSLGFDPTAVDQ